MTITCPHCLKSCWIATGIDVGQRIQCPFCDFKFSYGGDSSGLIKFCMACGTKMAADAKVCPSCGCDVKTGSAEAPSVDNAMTAPPSDSQTQRSSSHVTVNVSCKPVLTRASGKFLKMLYVYALFVGLNFLTGIVGTCDVWVYYSDGQGLYFVENLLGLVVLGSLGYFIFRCESWSRYAAIVLLALNAFGYVSDMIILDKKGPTVYCITYFLSFVLALVTLFLLFNKDVKAKFTPTRNHWWKIWLGTVLVAELCFVPLYFKELDEESTERYLRAIKAGNEWARIDLIDKLAEQNGNDREEVEAAVNEACGLTYSFYEQKREERRGKGTDWGKILKACGMIFVFISSRVGAKSQKS